MTLPFAALAVLWAVTFYFLGRADGAHAKMRSLNSATDAGMFLLRRLWRAEVGDSFYYKVERLDVTNFYLTEISKENKE